MKNFPLLSATTWVLIPSLLILSIGCYTKEAINLENADKSHHVVVVTNDGYLIRLLIWSVSDEGDILGAGSRFSDTSTTVAHLLDFSEIGIGDSFNGTIIQSEINSIYQEEYSPGRTVAFTTLVVILAVAALVGALYLVGAVLSLTN